MCRMTQQEAKAFVEKAFENLQARGWLAEGLKPALATEEEIDAFEKKRGVRLSPLYRAMLLSHPIGQLMTIMYHLERVSPLWMELDGAVSMEALEEQIEILQEMQDYCELPDGCFQNLIPIGDFGAGWGPMCLDLSRPEESVSVDSPASNDGQRNHTAYVRQNLPPLYDALRESRPIQNLYSPGA